MLFIKALVFSKPNARVRRYQSGVRDQDLPCILRPCPRSDGPDEYNGQQSADHFLLPHLDLLPLSMEVLRFDTRITHFRVFYEGPGSASPLSSLWSADILSAIKWRVRKPALHMPSSLFQNMESNVHVRSLMNLPHAASIMSRDDLPLYSQIRSGRGSPARSSTVNLPSGSIPKRSSTAIICRACCAECQVERSNSWCIGGVP